MPTGRGKSETDSSPATALDEQARSDVPAMGTSAASDGTISHSASQQGGPPIADSEHSDATVRDVSAKQLVEIISLLVPPTALLTGLLFYFGWVRTRQYWNMFGIEHSMLRFSVQDYLLRGIDAVHLPLTVTLAAILITIWGLVGASWWVRRYQPVGPLRVVAVVLAIIGAGLLMAGVTGAVRDGAAWLRVTSLLLTCGIFITGLAMAAARQVGRLGSRGRVVHRPWVTPVSVALVSMILMLTMFWFFVDYAGSVGKSQALARAASLPNRSQIVLYSQENLRIEGPGVEMIKLGHEGTYRFRYTGLTLLLRADDRYFLLPQNWSPGVRSIVVPISDALRVDFLPGSVSPAPG
jgi:hypothetical protein